MGLIIHHHIDLVGVILLAENLLKQHNRAVHNTQYHEYELEQDDGVHAVDHGGLHLAAQIGLPLRHEKVHERKESEKEEEYSTLRNPHEHHNPVF